MTTQEKTDNLKRLLAESEKHEEDMRISYLIAKDRTRLFRQLLKQPSLDSPERER